MVMCGDILSDDDYAIQMMVAGMVGQREDNNVEDNNASVTNASEDNNLSDDDYAIKMMVSGMVRYEDNTIDASDDNNLNESNGEYLQPLRQPHDPHNPSISAIRHQNQEQKDVGSYFERNVTKREIGSTFDNILPQAPILQPLSIHKGNNKLESQNKDCPILRLGSLLNNNNVFRGFQQGVIENVSTELDKVNLASPSEEQQPIPRVKDKENMYTMNPAQSKSTRDSYFAPKSISSSGFTPPKKKFRDASTTVTYTNAFDDVVARACKVQKFRSFRPRPGMSSSILGSSSQLSRPKPPPPITTENGTQTGHYVFLKGLPIATSWTLPMPWAVTSSDKTSGTQTNPFDTIDFKCGETPKEDLGFKFDQDFKIFVDKDDKKDDSFGSIVNCDLDHIPELDHAGVYIRTASRFYRNVGTNTAHVPWRCTVRRVPKFKKWIKAAKTWTNTKETITFGTQTDASDDNNLSDDDYAIQMMVSGMVRNEDNNIDASDDNNLSESDDSYFSKDFDTRSPLIAKECKGQLETSVQIE